MEILDDYDFNNNQLFQESKAQLEEFQQEDRGFMILHRPHPHLRNKKQRINAYSSGGIGCHIRDAISGQYSLDLVGSADEDLYFKVKLVDGNSTVSKNGSSTLFYESPYDCMQHQQSILSPLTIQRWTEKRDLFIKSLTKKHEDVVV
jgi:hypothetical protein